MKVIIKIFIIFLIIIFIASSIFVNSYEILPILHDEQIDQQETHNPNAGLFIYNSRYAAQSFRPTKTTLTKVEILCERQGTLSAGLNVSIRNEKSGPILTSIELPQSSIPESNPTWITFDFPDISVTPEVEYYIVVQTDAPGGAHPYPHYVWYGPNYNYYTRGTGWIFANGAWHTASDWTNGQIVDFNFKTWGLSNTAPYQPSNPSPGNDETGVSVNAVLSWTGGDPDPGETVYYDVYFGTSSTYHEVSHHQTGTTYDPPGNLDYNTQYYWKIVAWDEHGASTSGPIWGFITESNPQQYYTILFDFEPYGTGSTINFDGTDYGQLESISVHAGKYPIKANAGTLYKFSHWTSSCGTLDNPNSNLTYLTVSSSGTLQVHLFEKDSYYYIHMTDSHVNTESFTNYGYIRLKATLNHIRTLNPLPRFIIFSGDLADWASGSSYDIFKSCFKGSADQLYLLSNPLRVPIYICPGNHDYRWFFNLFIYDQCFSYPEDNDHCYLKTINNARIISMNSGCDALNFYGTLIPEGTGLSEVAYNWLSGTLSNSYWDKMNVIFMHHPALNKIGDNWGDGCILSRVDEFLNLCQNYRVGLILSGHLHYPNIYQYKNGVKSWIGNQPPSGYENGHHYYLTNGIPSTYTRTLQIITPSVLESYAYRIISVEDGDIVKVYYYDYAEETSTGDLIWLVGGSKGEPIADLRIEGGSRGSEDYYVVNLTDENNETYGKQGSFIHKGQDDYTFVIEGLQEGKVDFNCRHFCGDSRGEVMTYYNDIPLSKGDVAKLFVYKDSIDHTLYIDNYPRNEDGTYDMFLKPDFECINVPYIPDKPEGEKKGKPRTTYSYTAQTKDPESDNILYMFDWGDGTQSDWLGPFKSNSECTASKQWVKRGTYNVRVRGKDIYGYVSEWSGPLEVNICFLNSRTVYGGPFLNWLLNHFPILKNILILRNQ